MIISAFVLTGTYAAVLMIFVDAIKCSVLNRPLQYLHLRSAETLPFRLDWGQWRVQASGLLHIQCLEGSRWTRRDKAGYCRVFIVIQLNSTVVTATRQ
jgi:hypothetical protein